MDIIPIKEQIEKYKAEGKKMFATSSFQSHSIPLLHIISRIDNTIPIFFLNTGYLFPETLAFKDQLAEQFGLTITGIRSQLPKSQQKDDFGNLLFTSDPDYCCYLNKTQPLEPVLADYDVWINGIRADQNANRKNMQVEQKSKFGAIRYHPMLNWTSREIGTYAHEHNLPVHPLEIEGYLSIGCEPCTQKYIGDDSNDRSGRWFGMKKTECGLHTDLVEK